jgi:hypothetical protein
MGGETLEETKAQEKVAAVQRMFQDLLDRSRALRADLISDNDRLKHRVMELESDLSTAQSFLSSELADTVHEKERLRRQTTELQTENRDFAQRTVELEDRTANLANLYAATFQLHSTLSPPDVIQCVTEIALNLIGAADFALYLTDDAKGDFALAAREGEMSPDAARLYALPSALEKTALSEKRTIFREEFSGEPGGPLCCVPLLFRERLVGALSVYSLLSHKKTFTELDRELFDLLGGQAALAIVSSQAYVSVDRKLKTVQRFMELLKS